MPDEYPEDSRSGWDQLHFTVVFGGFCLAVGGVVVSSVCAALWGLVIIASGMAYFVVNNSDD